MRAVNKIFLYFGRLVCVTVVGNEIIMNCRACFASNGYGVNLSAKGSHFVCDYDASHRYVIEEGLMKRV